MNGAESQTLTFSTGDIGIQKMGEADWAQATRGCPLFSLLETYRTKDAATGFEDS